MKIYGIIREPVDTYDADVMLYSSRERRDLDYEVFEADNPKSYFEYTKFETELNEEERSEQ